MTRRIPAVAAIALLLPLGGCVERYYFYAPDNVSYVTPVARGLAYEDVRFPSADGIMLSGWFLPAKGKRLGTVAYFHGNNKNISWHLRYVEWLPSYGYDVLLFDYRGYGRSEGIPTPRGVHDDCVAALTYLRNRPDIDTNRLVVFGQSLGGSYALSALASMPRTGILAAVVEGAFASHREIARDKIASYSLPEAIRHGIVDLMIGDAHDAVSALRSINDIPVLVIHNADDEVVPYRHAKLLHSANPSQTILWTVPAGRHLDTFVLRGDNWRQSLVRHLQSLPTPPDNR